MSANSRSARGDGVSVQPQTAIVPILKELAPRRLKVVGTGCFITRYGLFVTAKHVLQDLVTERDPREIGLAFVLHLITDSEYVVRRITNASISESADVGVAQAQYTSPHGEIMNLRAQLSLNVPASGEALATFAYPENEIMDFSESRPSPPNLAGDFYEGSFQCKIDPFSRPFLSESHFETSVAIRSGASGCPIFDSQGGLVGIGSRGWEFRGGDHDGDDLSSVIPLRHLLAINEICVTVPPLSWEFAQLPRARRNAHLSFGELVAYEHVEFRQPQGRLQK